MLRRVWKQLATVVAGMTVLLAGEWIWSRRSANMCAVEGGGYAPQTGYYSPGVRNQTGRQTPTAWQPLDHDAAVNATLANGVVCEVANCSDCLQGHSRSMPLWTRAKDVCELSAYNLPFPPFRGCSERRLNRTLVVLQYSDVSRRSCEALAFFLRHGVEARADVDYLISINELSKQRPGVLLANIEPHLGCNVKILRRDNSCLDFGGYIAALWYAAQDIRDGVYKYIILKNMSVFGPILGGVHRATAQLVPNWHWSQIYTSLLDGKVLLSGISVNCERLRRRWWQNSLAPHVQSMLLAMSRKSAVMLFDAAERGETNLLRCDPSLGKLGIIDRYELGFSEFFLKRSYGIASLLTRDIGNMYLEPDRDCISEVNPMRSMYYSSITAHPLESVFHKLTTRIYTDELKKYAKWTDDAWLRARCSR